MAIGDTTMKIFKWVPGVCTVCYVMYASILSH